MHQYCHHYARVPIQRSATGRGRLLLTCCGQPCPNVRSQAEPLCLTSLAMGYRFSGWCEALADQSQGQDDKIHKVPEVFAQFLRSGLFQIVEEIPDHDRKYSDSGATSQNGKTGLFVGWNFSCVLVFVYIMVIILTINFTFASFLTELCVINIFACVQIILKSQLLMTCLLRPPV